MPSSHAPRLQRIAAGLGTTLDAGPLGALAQWLELLQTWNARMDLTAARTPDELCDLALADALVLSRLIAPGATVVDVGTGAGAPGLPLSLVRPDLHVTLVEPLTKRVSFLRTVIGTLHLGIAVVRDRGESVARTQPKAWAWAISRATLEPKAWLKLGQALARDRVAVMLAREEPPEGEVTEKVTYELPLTKKQRTLCVYRAEQSGQPEPRA